MKMCSLMSNICECEQVHAVRIGSYILFRNNGSDYEDLFSAVKLLVVVTAPAVSTSTGVVRRQLTVALARWRHAVSRPQRPGALAASHHTSLSPTTTYMPPRRDSTTPKRTFTDVFRNLRPSPLGMNEKRLIRKRQTSGAKRQSFHEY